MINGLMQVFKAHRSSAEVFLQNIFPDVNATVDELGIDLSIPGRCARQVHRPKVGRTVEDYYRNSIYLRYMDSLIHTLDTRFGESKIPYFSILAIRLQKCTE